MASTTTHTARRLTAKGRRTRSCILDAAERQFAERGYDGVSLRQIIDEAAVQMGQLQHFFPSKETVFSNVIARRLPELATGYADALEKLGSCNRSSTIDLQRVIQALLTVSRNWLTANDIGKHRYLRMMGLNTITFSQANYITEHTNVFKPLNEGYARWFSHLYPNCRRDRITAAYYLIEPSLASLLINIDSVFARSGRTRNAGAVGTMYHDLETFLVGGVDRLLTRP